MSRRKDPVYIFIVLPFILLIGVYFIGSVAEELFGIPAVGTRIFLGIGGVGFLVYYYRHWIKRLMF